jgi:calnexin
MKIFLYSATLLLAIGALFVHQTFSESDDDFEEDSSAERVDDAEVSTDDVPEPEPAPKRERPYYIPPVARGNVHFSDAFESPEEFNKRWVLSKSKKDGADSDIAKYDGEWSVEEPTDNPLQNDLGLVLKSKAKHNAVASKLKKPFEFIDKPLVVQYEVRFQDGQECGGAYIKLLSKTDKLELSQFNDKTPYTIMFGPDKCGNDHKLHFIFRHKNPLTGVFEEKHAKKPSAGLESYFSDKKTHLYTLVVKPENTFEIYVDQVQVNYGSLLEDMSPSVNPEKEITDPNDKKPADWDERERIKDPTAVKPEDWDETEPEMIEDDEAEKPEGWLDDEPELIPDPAAEKPSDWDEDMDGEWEAPMINNPKCDSSPGCGKWKRPQVKNPKYKGKWSAPMIDNPDYKGKWAPKMIPNPNYFEDLEPFKMTSIAAVGLELWSMSNNILFDNFIITDSKTTADNWAAESWQLKHSEESASSTSNIVQSVIDATHERPWLWAVIIVVVVLPIVLIIAYCCMSSPKTDETAARKKTDVASPDDNEEEEDDVKEDEEEDGEKNSQAEGDGPSTPEEPQLKRRTKADLETKQSKSEGSKSKSDKQKKTDRSPKKKEAADEPSE